jgi:hypothetical protein
VNTDHHDLEQAAGHLRAEEAGSEHYEIRVDGRLSSRWSAWFDGFSLSSDDEGTTVLSGPVVDQAALHGLLQKLRDLGITLLSLTRTDPGDTAASPVSPTNHPHRTTPGASS